MELKSTISDTWKLCTFGSIVGCFLLLLFLNQSPQLNLSAARNTMIETAPLSQLDYGTNTTMIKNPESQPEPKLEPLNSTSNPLISMTKGSELELELEPSNSTSEPLTTMTKVGLVSELKPEPMNITIDHPIEKANSTINPIEPEPASITIDHPIERENSTINPIEPETVNISIDHPIEKANSTINPIEKPTNKTSKKCNIFEGRWVYKEEHVPSYNSSVCPFLEEKMSCLKNGRPDSDYEKWIWEGRDCDVPLFNARDMLERLRNKRMIVVGDSLNRNLWESLACLIYSSIHPSRAFVSTDGPAYKILKAKDYNFKLEFYWSPFLIEMDETHESGRKVLVLDKLSPSSKQWRGADVMVFNSGHWWTHHGKMKWWDQFEYEGRQVKDMRIELAYQRAMKTWAKWVKTNVNPKKTTVFFRSISTLHNGKQWCYNFTRPFIDESYNLHFPKSLIGAIESQIEEINEKMQVVKYLNITKLSGYRIDAHPSVYRSWRWKIYTQKYKRLIPSYADCSHWCLPGLPDTWSRLLYTSLFFDTQGDMSVS